MTTLHPLAVYILRRPGWHVRVLLAVVITLALANLPPPVAGMALWILALPYLMMVETLARILVEQRRARQDAEVDRDGRVAEVAERDIRIARLSEDLAQARALSQRSDETDGDPVYRSVGLSTVAPDWLVQAARTAYRRRLHPDVHPSHHRTQAHERYIRAEQAFERIEKLRA